MILTEQPVPQLYQSQIQKFNFQSIRAQQTHSFHPSTLLDYLKRNEGRQIIGVDIGGDKIASCTYIINNGQLTRQREPLVFKSEKGAGYLEYLENIAQVANTNSIPVGISFPGIVEGTKLIDEPNVKVFEKDLNSKYAGYFSNLFHQVFVANDGEMGLLSASILAINKFPHLKNLLFVIVGSGVNTSVLKDGQIFSCESGHVEVVPELNVFQRTKKCEMFGAQYVCIENLSGGEAFIKDVVWEQTKNILHGYEIAAKLDQGDKLIADLYSTSAFVVSHLVVGVGNVFELFKENTAIVCHGGVFNVPSFSDRVQQIVTKNVPDLNEWIFTKDFTDNASLDGAAVAALYFG